MVRGQVARQGFKANYLKVLAHPVRLEIIGCLKDGERVVGDIVSTVGIGQSNVSRHLAALKNANILASRQEGANVYYAVADDRIFRVLRLVDAILKSTVKERFSLFGGNP
ncbi:MAG: metalloregulator ArsR/SmtB family transcription factor [Candidatus Omnitrophota bacterium]